MTNGGPGKQPASPRRFQQLFLWHAADVTFDRVFGELHDLQWGDPARLPANSGPATSRPHEDAATAERLCDSVGEPIRRRLFVFAPRKFFFFFFFFFPPKTAWFAATASHDRDRLFNFIEASRHRFEEPALRVRPTSRRKRVDSRGDERAARSGVPHRRRRAEPDQRFSPSRRGSRSGGLPFSIRWTGDSCNGFGANGGD